ncbi:MAG: BREX-1 system adenine-specific DNA-methyltransferase PglX, partial [Planctomycetota bacterium]|nr:BREX-1 system adenine-specific DNA-methyltransferase PglX [Planctomycetota bacterium]
MDAQNKKILKAISLELRHLLEGQYDASPKWQPGDLEKRLAAIGVRRDREPVSVDELAHLAPADQKARQVVDAYLKLRAEAGVSREDAVAEFVRETAYTWANRLLALRCMEARELIDEVILQKPSYGGRSLEHHRLAQRQPELCAGEDDGLLAALDKVFAEQSRHLPLLFDPEAPGVALKPSAPAIKRCVALLSGTEAVRGQEPATIDVFKAPDALGWAYQYWNTEEKDRVFTKVRTQKGAKIEGANIVPATQLYTESYMVKFLVQNSLGATWMGMHPESKLSENWEYYVRDADRVPVEQKPIAEVTFLDPACGSGHFLLEAFDLLYDMYEEEGRGDDSGAPREATEICRSILERNLFGIDIDARAVQIAEAALWMKAAERVFPNEFPGVQTNLVAAVASHLKGPLWEDFLTSFGKQSAIGNVLGRFGRAMEHIDELGSLARPEEALRAIVHDEHAKWEQARRERTDANYLFAEMRTDALSGQLPLPELSDTEFGDRLLTSVRVALNAFTEKARSEGRDPSRLLGRETQIGLRWIDVLGRKYDVVAANPPYMGSKNMGAVVKKHVELLYSAGKRDVYAAFLQRGVELTAPCGRLAMVTQQSWMFLKSFTELRSEGLNEVRRGQFIGVLVDASVECLAHLGRYAFSEIGNAAVAPVLFIIRRTAPGDRHRIWACRLTAPRPSEEQAAILLSAVRGNQLESRFCPQQRRFWAIPGTPLCYWLSSKLLDLLAERRFGDSAEIHAGLCTGHDSRFTRFFWEANAGEWQAIAPKRRWFPYEKGAGYGRWCGHQHWLVEWQGGGTRLKGACLPGTRIQSEAWYLRSGWTYSYMACGSFGLRRITDDTIISHLSAGVFFTGGAEGLAALTNCRLSSMVVRALSAKMQLNESYVARIPLPPQIPSLLSDLERELIRVKSRIVARDLCERSADPSKPVTLIGELAEMVTLLSLEGICERVALNAYELSAEDLALVLAETGTPAGWHPIISVYDDVQFRETEDLSRTPEMRDLRSGITTLEGWPDERRAQLRTLFEAGPGAAFDEMGEEHSEGLDDDDVIATVGANIPIPPETFLEELSQKLAVHPISLFGLIKEGVDQEGWRCLPEERRLARDRLTVLTLQLLGHRWPRQVADGESAPDWADPDGIIPLTECRGERTLAERIAERNSFHSSVVEADPSRSGNAVPAKENGVNSVLRTDFPDLMGKSLDHWLTTEFFKHHISQFKKRPIAWQIQSGKFTARRKPAFACLVYYHKLNGDLLPKLCKQYAGHLQQRMETELRGIEGLPAAARSDRQEARRNELGDQIPELQEFDAKLREVQESAFATDGLRAAAIQDGLLCLKQAWLRRLADAVRSGPLGQWVDAARTAAIHADLPGWIEVAMSQLDRHCTRVGPDDSQWDSADEPTPVTAAKFICTKPGQMVTEALTCANGCWAGQVHAVVIAPLRQQIGEKQDRQKTLKAELKASTEGDTTVHAIGELKVELDRLKVEIRDLQSQVDDIQGRCDRLRAMINEWNCPGVDDWESWLAVQPL